MSIDTPTVESTEPAPTVACGLCGTSAPHDGDARFMATYATDGVAPPTFAADDGVLALCGHCAQEVRELTVAWGETERPAVDSAPSIAVGYRHAVSECGFCEDAVEDGDPLLGVESWAPLVSDADDATDLSHYALCETCAPIFEEFLDGVADDVR